MNISHKLNTLINRDPGEKSAGSNTSKELAKAIELNLPVNRWYFTIQDLQRIEQEFSQLNKDLAAINNSDNNRSTLNLMNQAMSKFLSPFADNLDELVSKEQKANANQGMSLEQIETIAIEKVIEMIALISSTGVGVDLQEKVEWIDSIDQTNEYFVVWLLLYMIQQSGIEEGIEEFKKSISYLKDTSKDVYQKNTYIVNNVEKSYYDINGFNKDTDAISWAEYLQKNETRNQQIKLKLWKKINFVYLDSLLDEVKELMRSGKVEKIVNYWSHEIFELQREEANKRLKLNAANSEAASNDGDNKTTDNADWERI